MSSRAYDQLVGGQITEIEALAIIDHQVTSPTLNFDLSSSDLMVGEGGFSDCRGSVGSICNERSYN